MIRRIVSVRPRFWLLAIGLSAALIVGRFLLDTQDHFEADGGAMRAYISAISTLYGILAAFTIYTVWNQHVDADSAVRLEANELADVCRYAVYLDDPGALDQLIATVRRYASTVTQEEWTAMASGNRCLAAEQALERVFSAVNEVRFDDARDNVAWGQMIRKFESVRDARERRLKLAGERIPSLMRGLLYLSSLLLVLGFFMVAIQNDFIAVAATIGTTAIVFLTIEVVEDLDDPFDGEWALSGEPFGRVHDQLSSLERRELARSQ